MRQHRGRTVRWFAGILVAGAIAGCQDGAGPGPRVTGIQLGRASQDLAVTATDPTGAPQDTTLDVTVSGSGFDDGSTVQLTLSGVPTEKVRTNSTRYRNRKTLIANITIAADAEVDFYDVEVTTASRKKGIGSEMFEVFVGGQQVVIAFRRPASAELESFFADVATLDFASAPQPVQGKINGYSIQTKMTPFTLSLEPSAEFYDDKDPRSDPLCETEWFEVMLEAAAANGGSLDGSLEVDASWSTDLISISVWFIVALDPWEYAIRVPMHGPQEDRLIQVNGERTVLALREGYPRFWRRRLGPNAGTLGGNWPDAQMCLMNSDRSNGFMDFEIWVQAQ